MLIVDTFISYTDLNSPLCACLSGYFLYTDEQWSEHQRTLILRPINIAFLTVGRKGLVFKSLYWDGQSETLKSLDQSGMKRENKVLTIHFCKAFIAGYMHRYANILEISI